MTTFAAVDPGKHGCGVAVFRGSELIGARYISPGLNPLHKADHFCGGSKTNDNYQRAHCVAFEVLWFLNGYRPTSVIVEHMRKYPGPDKIDINDLLDVQTVAAMVAASNSGVESVYPPVWKGNVKKEVMTTRIRKALSSMEAELIEEYRTWPKSLDHNVYDAIGIGLWKLGRLNKREHIGATK